MPGGGMHHQPGGFVQHQHVRILVHHLQWNVFCDQGGLLGHRHSDDRGLTAFKAHSGLGRQLPVYQHLPALNQALNLRTRKVRHELDQRLVQAFTALCKLKSVHRAGRGCHCH